MLVALALLAAAPSPTDPDLRCVAAISAVLGAVGDKHGADADPEVFASLTGVFMYFLGKVDARHPGFDYARALGSVVNEPGYDKALAQDLKRCGAEAEERGAMLKRLGEQMKTLPPQAG